MGRSKHRNRKRNANNDNSAERQQKKAQWQEKRQGQGQKHYEDLRRENKIFDKYYQGQGFVPEGEWDDFHKTLTNALPVTFRINGNRSQAKEMLEIIQGQYLQKMTEVKVDGEVVQPPKRIDWYPDQLAWHMDVSRKAMRSTVMYSKFHQFLVAETESGNISRQEAVSMIPPLLLDIKPHHKVLDMCAAPGSKTAQLIELLHADEKQRVPDGFVIANDADNKRCYLMVHQVKRLLSPCCMIVNHDASIFPKFRSNRDGEGQKMEFYQFDRILADVPCSGDGTLRKNPDLWKKWNPTHAYSLHGLQMKILKRGLELLAVGGRLVYSTCSFHPAEDEAVVAHMLKKCQGSVELIDAKSEIPELKTVPGIKTWRIMSKEGTWYEKYEDLPSNLTNQIRDTMFPPTPEEETTMNLERCIRVLPHHQNTGGFFIAVFQKTTNLPWLKPTTDETSEAEVVKMVENEADKTESDSQISAESTALTSGDDKKRKPESPKPSKPSKKPRLQGYKEDPFLFMSADDPMWPSTKKFYELPDDFPCDQAMYRSEEGSKRSLYFVSAGIKNIVECNRERLRFINMGVKLFSRSPSPLVPDCDFRVAQECLTSLHMKFTGRHIDIAKEDACIILTEENPFISSLSDKSAKQLNEICPGSVVFYYKPEDSNAKPQCEVVFCGWRGKVSVRSFIGDHDRQHNLMLFGMSLEEIKAKAATLKAERKALAAKSVVDPLGIPMDSDKEEKQEFQSDEKLGNKNEQSTDNKESTQIDNGDNESKEQSDSVDK
ncbi:hypothetical protein SNE40_000925 [Patella caerulea]|uniref:tRNA (cytosine(34)-C(5))-methyltransferase n=1 Tax=Patella caerulea TaxID=87958 RepID=A0AAN8K631_PATCE